MIGLMILFYMKQSDFESFKLLLNYTWNRIKKQLSPLSLETPYFCVCMRYNFLSCTRQFKSQLPRHVRYLFYYLFNFQGS